MDNVERSVRLSKRFSSVKEMVESMSPSFAKKFEKRINAKKIINSLVVKRGVVGLTVKDVAERMKVKKSYVEKIEDSVDADIKVGDLIKYAKTIGIKNISFNDGEKDLSIEL